jgi:valyl-tRNA synthetase
MLARLRVTVLEATDAMGAYENARALESTEHFFWSFCDDYLELVKNRAYRNDDRAPSARYGLGVALSVMLRLFAPFLPFATEEAWSWWHEGSIHRATWPTAEECGDGSGDPEVVTAVAAALGEIRRAKTSAKQSMRATAKIVTITANQAHLDRVALGRDDLVDAGTIVELVLTTTSNDEIRVDVDLETPDEVVPQ